MFYIFFCSDNSAGQKVDTITQENNDERKEQEKDIIKEEVGENKAANEPDTRVRNDSS